MVSPGPDYAARAGHHRADWTPDPHPVPPLAAVWLVHPAPDAPESLPQPSTVNLADDAWRPLTQSWRDAGLEPAFRPGRARLGWRPDALIAEWLFHGSPLGNRARSLNEPTWELGDVGELFVQAPDRAEYFEFHVTPENCRLQLRWPPGGLAGLRAGHAPLAQFTLGVEADLGSETTVGANFWSARLTVPARTLGLARFAPSAALRAAVCRYDCARGRTPVNSSTAPLRTLAFHRPHDWTPLLLLPA